MSVRMALAKLCACACGGAVLGGGAIHVADTKAGGRYHSPYMAMAAKSVRPIARKPAPYVAKRPRRVVKRIRRITTTSVTCAPKMIEIATTTAPMAAPAFAPPAPPSGVQREDRGFSRPVYIGGGFGTGFGGYGGGPVVVVASASSSSASSASASSSASA
ncbi:MAG: hypothetical protein RJB22_1447, partial [Pseudomonadota bacterium]